MQAHSNSESTRTIAKIFDPWPFPSCDRSASGSSRSAAKICSSWQEDEKEEAGHEAEPLKSAAQEGDGSNAASSDGSDD
eukprot:2007196-Pleurochrysis_carterae.AAC.1